MPIISKNYNLKIINPTLSSQWHPTANGSLTTEEVTPFSNKKVWWICEKGHEWQAVIEDRTRGTGCPDCFRMRMSKLMRSYRNSININLRSDQKTRKGKRLINSRISDPYVDRRSGEDRREIYQADYFENSGIERRSRKDRRQQGERRKGFIRVSKWSSVYAEKTA